MERPLIDRAVTEEAECDAILAAVLNRKRQPNPQRYVRGNDRVATIHMMRHIEKMHRPTEPSRAAGFFSEKLRHTCIGARAPGQGMPVITVSGNDVIIRAHGSDRPDHDSFLANVKVTKAANLLRLILLTGAFFEAPDRQHQREHLDFVALPHRLHSQLSGSNRTELRSAFPRSPHL